MAAAEPCGCNCCIEPVVSMTFNQTASRFNERASYANVNQMDNQTLLLSMFQAQAQNSLEQTPQTELISMLAQLIALSQAGT